MVESFEQLGTGKWRIVYAGECSTSFGFGSFFGGVSSVETELECDGKVTCMCKSCAEHDIFDAFSIIDRLTCSFFVGRIHCNKYQVSVEGSYGTGRFNGMVIARAACTFLIMHFAPHQENFLSLPWLDVIMRMECLWNRSGA